MPAKASVMGDDGLGRLRWQASSYRILRCRELWSPPIPVGAGLPAKASVSETMRAVRPFSLASQLLQDLAGVHELVVDADPCRSRLAGEGGVSSAAMLADRPLSLASQLLQGSCRSPINCGRRQSPVGAGLPAKAVCQSTSMLAVRPLSLASQLLQGSLASQLCSTPIPCRSRLAGEGGLSVDIDAGCPAAFAGKPAPTGICRVHRIVVTPIPCRSRLAGEGGVSVDIDAGCQTAFAGKPAPTCGSLPVTGLVRR